ncbi:hypothetical protein D3C85_1402590 [compost metagenome]
MARFLAALIATEPFFEELKYVDRSPEAIRGAVSVLRRHYDAADFPRPKQLIPLGGSYGADMALIVSHLQSALDLAESDNLGTRKDRLQTAGFVRGAIAFRRCQTQDSHC